MVFFMEEYKLDKNTSIRVYTPNECGMDFKSRLKRGLNWHKKNIPSRLKANRLVKELNHSEQTGNLKFKKKNVSYDWYMLPGDMSIKNSKIVISGLENICNGFYVQCITREICKDAYDKTRENFDVTLPLMLQYSEDGETDVPVYEGAEEFAKEYCINYAKLYLSALEKIEETSQKPHSDTKENIIQTAEITGYIDRFLSNPETTDSSKPTDDNEYTEYDKEWLFENSFGLWYEQASPKEKEKMDDLIKEVFFSPEK